MCFSTSSPISDYIYKNLKTRITLAFVITLLATGSGYGDDLPVKETKLNLARGFAIKMAVSKNIDLRAETLNALMAETDLARTRGLYDAIFSVSGSGGISYVPGEPFFLTKNSTSSIALTQYLPTGGSIAASTQAGFTTAETNINRTSTTDWQSSVGITLSHPLLKNAGKETTELSITLAVNTLQDTLERFRSSATDTVLSVISSYNRLYTVRHVLESRVAALNSAQNLLDEISKKVKPGPQQKMELANAEFAIAQRRRDLVDAQRNVSDQEANLRYLIGIEEKIKIIPIDPPSREEPQETEEQAVKASMELRSDLNQLRMSLKSSQLQERVARHQTLPDLFLTASGGFSGIGDDFGSSFRKIGERPSRFWSASMQFSRPIGNTSAENDYRRSKFRAEQVHYQIKALEWKIRNEVETDMRALISARLQIQTAERSLKYAEQRLEEYRKSNRAGTATVQDVINAENDLIFARNAQMDALETFANTVAKLWRDMGLLLDRQGVHIDISKPEKLMEDKG